jgi:heptosyltransferase III
MHQKMTKSNPISTAVLCAGGLGDGLLMMITANGAKKSGRAVTIYHNLHKILSPLFPTFSILPYPGELIKELQAFDQIIVENDNSARAWDIMENRHHLKNCCFFFPTPSRMATSCDYTFSKGEAIGKSIAKATATLFSLETPQMENGLFIPTSTKNQHPKRIVIHPTSADPKRNWKQKQFLQLAKKLQSKGYEIAFAMSAAERKEWQIVTKLGFSLPTFNTLSDTANYIYASGYLIGNDSGLGHLASNLGIPTLTISGNPKRVSLWRPSWAPGKVATLLIDLPNFKGIRFRFREHFWQYFISMTKVYRRFQELANET